MTTTIISGDQQSVVQDGPLRYHAAADTTVYAVTLKGRYKLFRILFGKDGSIYIPFPYLDTKRGVLSAVDPAIQPNPKKLDLKRDGVVVTEDVKFSHHTSGIVQFSKSGGQDLLPRRRSFRLDGPIGRIFDLHVYWMHGFKQLALKKNKRTLLLPFDLRDKERTSLRISGEWRRKRDIVDNLEPGGRWLGPRVSAVERKTGRERHFLLLGQPSSRPLIDHVLMLSAEDVQHADGAVSPTMIFMGGWDHHEGTPPATPKMLSFMYPVRAEASSDSA